MRINSENVQRLKKTFHQDNYKTIIRESNFQFAFSINGNKNVQRKTVVLKRFIKNNYKNRSVDECYKQTCKIWRKCKTYLIWLISRLESVSKNRVISVDFEPL